MELGEFLSMSLDQVFHFLLHLGSFYVKLEFELFLLDRVSRLFELFGSLLFSLLLLGKDVEHLSVLALAWDIPAFAEDQQLPASWQHLEVLLYAKEPCCHVERRLFLSNCGEDRLAA